LPLRLAVTGAVEGDLDETLLRRILGHVGMSLGTVYGRKGKRFLLQSINGYNNAAQYAPWVVLVDLDRDGDCAPPCVQKWLARPSAQMCFRVAVRSIEAWLLADRERIGHLVSRAWLPANPDSLDDPKRELINLARRSRRRGVREDLVPRQGSGRSVGPLYTTRMIEFLQDEAAGWRLDQALRVSESLERCVLRLRNLAEAVAPPSQHGQK
jgi:hypothetical protein